MVTDIISTLTSLVSGVSDAIVGGATSLVGLFWNQPSTGDGNLTFLGIFALVGFSVFLIQWVVRLLTSFIKSRR